MHDDATVAAVFRGLRFISEDTVVSRFIADAHRTTALKAVGQAGRYNSSGIRALYTSYLRQTALADATHMFADDDPIADLTDPATLRKLGVRRADLDSLIINMSHGTAVSQRLGKIAYDTKRFHGLKVWSRIRKREKNLVLFVDALKFGYTLHDPDHDLWADHPTVLKEIEEIMKKLKGG